MKKFLLLLALFCLVGGNIVVVDCSASGEEEETYEIEEEEIESDDEEKDDGDISLTEKVWKKILPDDYLRLKESTATNPDIQTLQNKFIKEDTRVIKQLQSINQMSPANKDIFTYKCAFFAMYNLLEIHKILISNPNDLEKYELNKKCLLGSKNDSIQESKLNNNFKSWVKKLEPNIKKQYKKYISTDEIEKKTKIEESFENNDELDGGQMAFVFNTMLFENIDTNRVLILGQKDLNDGFENPEDLRNWLNITNDFNEKELTYEKEHYSYGKFYKEIKNFRDNGSPIYLILLMAKHWFCAVMTIKGMYIANSYENSLYATKTQVEKLYDYILFGNIPEETKSDVKPITPTTITTPPSLTKKDPLETALALLKAKLLSLTKQLTTKS